MGGGTRKLIAHYVDETGTMRALALSAPRDKPVSKVARMLDKKGGCLRGARLVDWAAEPYILGGYSAPSFGEGDEARRLYRRPECGGRLAFCGEATEDAMMTMSAALDSGCRAGAEVLAATTFPPVLDSSLTDSSWTALRPSSRL